MPSAPSRLSIVLALISLVLALIACGLAFGWRLGDVGGWLSGVGTIAAAGAALHIATRDRRERARERLAADEAQARLVIVTPRSEEHAGGMRYAMHYHNYGAQPILDVRLARIELRAYPRAVATFEERIDRLVRAEEGTGTQEATFVDEAGNRLPQPTSEGDGPTERPSNLLAG